MRVDRIYEHRIVWDNKLADRSSEPFTQLSFESVRAVSYITKKLCFNSIILKTQFRL